MRSDILILGGGIIGLLSALNLAWAGLEVAVLDRGEMGRESTWAGAGILSPLLPWDYGSGVNALSERGRALWPALADFLGQGTGIDPEYWRCGMLALGDFDLTAAQAWCAAWGWRCEAPAPQQLAAFPPASAALWLPDVAQARNPRVARALVAACRQAGVRLLAHRVVTGLVVENGRARAVHTQAGTLHAERFVVCAGAWSPALLGPHALGLHIVPVRGQILLLRGPPGIPRHIVLRQGRYLVPRRDGLILVGSTLEDAGFDKTPTPEARLALLDFARGTLPALHACTVVLQWAGLRPGSPGNLPTIARHPELDNLFINAGHFRYGVTMAPAAAELLVQLMLARPTTLDALPYAWPRT
ncbi:MAG TPA: glycine oxidase ThiO [Thiobacillaceae bacterium]|nr:glycine oxidase ThiO [Thiobacillaceae bacterium]HNU65222.1 glycine oxidase ThiO [Thiobacillaceae bacterium]